MPAPRAETVALGSDGEEGGLPAVELWHADLDRCGEALVALDRETPRVPVVERERLLSVPGGGNYRFAAHVALRLVLERLHGTAIGTMPFARSAAGRPSLVGVAGDFSLSHSGRHALIAVAREGSVGVDVERPRAVAMTARRQAAIIAAARAISGAVEADAPLHGDDETDAFFAAWVRLEAYAKARRSTLARLLTAAGALGGARPQDAAELAARLGAFDSGERVYRGSAMVYAIRLPTPMVGALVHVAPDAAGMEPPGSSHGRATEGWPGLSPRLLPDNHAGLAALAR